MAMAPIQPAHSSMAVAGKTGSYALVSACSRSAR
jgi:hypothetical protein